MQTHGRGCGPEKRLAQGSIAGEGSGGLGRMRVSDCEGEESYL